MLKSLLLLLSVALVACSAKVTQVPFLDRVMTVSDFTAAPDMRKKVSAFCGNDPGQTMLDPNCRNAQQSLHLSYSGTGNFPKIDTSVPK
jgi:hypothetical protein